MKAIVISMLGLLLSAAASAAPVQFTYSGILLTSVPSLNAEVGDNFLGTIKYDSEQKPQPLDSSPLERFYNDVNFTLSVNGQEIIRDTSSFTAVSFTALGINAQDSQTNWHALWTNGDEQSLNLSGLRLPTNIIAGAVQPEQAFVDFGQLGGTYEFRGQITNVIPTPIPPALWLFASAILGLAVLARRGKN